MTGVQTCALPIYNVRESQCELRFKEERTGLLSNKIHLDKYKQERDKVLQKIQEIANKVYVKQSPQISMFGSLITGLALESSDMDLVVQGLNISDR